MIRNRSAFTLIELLVVITIIIILVSLIMAVAPAMIKRGYQTTSLNNMRQIATMLNLYANDNDNRYPRRPPNGDGSERWPFLLNRDYRSGTKVFADPGDPDNFIRKGLDPVDNGENNTSYIINGGSDDQFAEPDRPINRAAVDKPSDTILVGVVWKQDPNFFMDINEGNEELINKKLYGSGSNYVFMDGSARYMEEKDYENQNSQNGLDSYLWRISKTQPKQ